MGELIGLGDMRELKTKGVQVVRSFFPETIRLDLAARAQEIISLRDAGKLTTFDQDSKGLPDEWFMPLVRDPSLLRLLASALGPNICTAGIRVLAKDRHFKMAVHVHQDWAYANGDTNKTTVFIPLTRMNRDNGGLIFIEESHQYGPVARGAINRSRFPPMKDNCPDVDVGDLILCDFMTWHYSEDSLNGEERILLQFNYQPADDASSVDVVAGVRSHDKLILSPFDAVEFPQSRVNGKSARELFKAGDLATARRYAGGLLLDDDQHSSVALLISQILTEQKDPNALKYLEMARASVGRQLADIAVLDRHYGLESVSSADLPGSIGPPDQPSPWRSLDLSWRSAVEGTPDTDALPATFRTPDLPWSYGAISSPITVSAPATIRIRARAAQGRVGFCLIGSGNGPLVSEQHHISPESGEATIMIMASPEHPQVQLVARNFDDAGVSGEVTIASVDMLIHG